MGRPAAKRPASGICPRGQAGDPSAGLRSCGIPLAGPTKMHRVGLASVQLTRSTAAEATACRECLQPSALRARCNSQFSREFHIRQEPSEAIRRKLRLSPFASGKGITREQAGVDSTRNWSTKKRTEAGSPSSDLPTDRRRSDCRSEGHQPQALRPRCNWETTGRSTTRQVVWKHEIRYLRLFLYNPNTIAPSRT